jgi:hypothetical protein
MTRYGLMLAMFLCFSSISFGQRGAEALAHQCNAPQTDLSRLACGSYLGGFWEALQVQSALTPNSRMVCPPEEQVTTSQLTAIIVKWFSDHPPASNSWARAQVMAAFKDAFPCKNLEN